MSNLWDHSRTQPSTELVIAGETLSTMFWNAVAERGPKVWLREKDLGIWKSWTWTEVGEAVAEIAGGLMSLGLAPGNTASILSNTVLEWVLCDLAVLSCGGIANGIYPTDAPPRCITCARTRPRACCSSRTTSSWTRPWRCATSCPC